MKKITVTTWNYVKLHDEIYSGIKSGSKVAWVRECFTGSKCR